MELKEYLKIIKKYLTFIAICAVGGAALGAFSTKFLPKGYNLSQTVFLAPPQSITQGTYNYEGFYAQEKARNFTDTAVAILESEDFKSEVTANDQALSVKKLAPQVIRLIAIGQSPASSQDLMAKTINTFNKKFIDLSLKPIGQSPKPTFQASSRKVYTTAGFVLGLVTAVVVISLKTYFKL